MQESHSFGRGNISDDLANRIRQLIVDGALEAGARINEVHLARELGVSRTPLREAIAQLVREQTLVSIPRIGSFVKPLSIEEFEQLYPIRPLLDCEALRLAGIPPESQLDQLERLNARLADAKDADTIITLDDEWHLLLVTGCENAILIDLIRDFIRRTRRYELALMREQQNLAAATDEHQAIIAALRRSELDAAIGALRHNLTSGFEPIRDWLAAREGVER
jgi:DNA-binding GntR family transcriptional regulator